MNNLRTLLALVLLVVSPAAQANDAMQTGDKKPDDIFPYLLFSLPDADKNAMDIHPSVYQDFWKTWHFVTVRWRQDIREFRYTFANDLAWKTLSEHRTDYPVGAMFGKLIYPSEEDLALPSSVLPSNALSRLEVILWDPTNKKASSDGWVYLRFINRGSQFEQDKDSTGIWGVMSDKEIKGCVDCHVRAADRGFVFSQPAFLFHDLRPTDNNSRTENSVGLGDLMSPVSSENLPHIAKSLINTLPEWKSRKVMGREGDYILGSFSESSLELSKLAQEHKDTIYMLYDRDDPDFLALASNINKKGYDRCTGIVRMSGQAMQKDPLIKGKNLNSAAETQTKTTANTSSAQILDLKQMRRPSAVLYIICNSEGVSRQELPLQYTVKDQDGLPSYYFAPAKLD